MQKNDYLVAKIGVDTAENEPLQVWGVIQFNIQSGPYVRHEKLREGHRKEEKDEKKKLLLEFPTIQQ